jgi:hypothetical protein
MAIAGLIGCTQNVSEKKSIDSLLDRNWGRSFESAKYNQTLNTDAGKIANPVEGLEGPVGERIMEGYMKGGDPKKKPPTEFGVVTIKQ